MGNSKRNAVQVKASLAGRKLPDSDVTWLELAEQIANEVGVPIDVVCGPSKSSSAAVVRQRHWAVLHAGGCNCAEIAQAWHTHRSTVLEVVQRLPPPAPKPDTLFGLTANAYHALRGFMPVCDAVERAEWWLDPAHHLGAVSEQDARDAIAVLDGAGELLAEESPRGDGARFALASLGGQARLTDIRDRALEVIGRAAWERAEASAVTGGLVEEAEA